MSGTEEQLISFFLYSMFIYPVTNYLVSPKRSYARWKGALYAILFLALISTIHLVYENRERGPNHYNLLGVMRNTSTANLKKAYRNLSLELHPDKNKSPTAPQEFQKVKHAFDVLLNPDSRQVYDRLGDAGVKTSTQTVIDHKYIIIQMLVYYSSSLIFAFLMTFAESSGDAMITSLFGLATMLLIESALVLEQFQIPVWLLPYHTAHDVVTLMHRLFPAFMNGSRCIVGAFVVDHRAGRAEALAELSEALQSVTQKTSGVIQNTQNALQNILMAAGDNGGSRGGSSGSSSNSQSIGYGQLGGFGDSSRNPTDMTVAAALQSAGLAPGVDVAVCLVKKKAALVEDPKLLRQQDQSIATDYSWLRNLAIYLIARFVIVKSNRVTSAASKK